MTMDVDEVRKKITELSAENNWRPKYLTDAMRTVDKVFKNQEDYFGPDEIMCGSNWMMWRFLGGDNDSIVGDFGMGWDANDDFDALFTVNAPHTYIGVDTAIASLLDHFGTE